MNILLIGANGFLGKELHNYLKNYEFNIFCTSHQESSKENFSKFDIHTKLDNKILDINFEAVIYLSHIYDTNKSDDFISWYKKTFMLLSKKAKKQIYISSYSANPNAKSNYGLSKYEIEKFFIENNAYSISPGLIIGDGGIYNKIKNIVLKLPIIVIPVNKKENSLPIIEVKYVNSFIKNIIDNDIERKNYNLFSEMIDLKGLVKKIAKEYNKRRIVLGINATFTLKVMQIIESIGIKLPITSDSLIGFISNQKYDIKSDIKIRNA